MTGHDDDGAAGAARATAALSAGEPVWWRAYGADAASAASALTNQMSRDEQLRLVEGVGFGFGVPYDGYFYGNLRGVPRLGVPSTQLHDASQGYRTHRQEIVGQVTGWPCMLALGATWDVPLMRTLGSRIAREFKAKGVHVMLGPVRRTYMQMDVHMHMHMHMCHEACGCTYPA